MTRRSSRHSCLALRGLFCVTALTVSACTDPDPTAPAPPPAWEALIHARPHTLWLAQRDVDPAPVWARTATSGWIDVSDEVTWESDDPQVLSITGDGARAHSRGQTRLTARLRDLSASRWITVTDDALDALSMWPRALTLIPGSRHPLSLVATSSAGPLQARDVVTWSSSAPEVASVDPASAHVLAHAPGRATIYAQADGARARLEVNVEAAALERLDIEPVLTTLPPSSALSVRASALIKDAGAHDVTHSVRWSTSDARVARVVDAVLYTYEPGQVVLSASGVGGQRSVTVTVREQSIDALELAPDSITFAPGHTMALRAIATVAGGQLELTHSAQWRAQRPMETGHFWGAGELYSPSPTTSRVVASFGGAAAQVVALVEPPEALPEGVFKLDPSTLTLPAGASFPVEARRTDDASRLTAQATWWSEDPGVAFVGVGPLERGKLRAVSPGRTTIWARWGGATARMEVDVTDAALARIELTPLAARVPVGYRGQYSATGVFDDGSSLYITQEVTWDSSAPQTVHVHNTPGRQGRSVAQEPGTATITASWRGVRGSTVITVNP